VKIGLPVKRKTRASKLNEARLQAARRNTEWTELDPVDLVPRPHGVLVAATTDWAYRRHRGDHWETGTAAPIAAHASLYFYEDHDSGAPVFVERMAETWSQQVARTAS
jgi:hypothetical protein